MNHSCTCRKSEPGVALILAMLTILVLTVLAASIVFVSQSQIWTSLNYRLTTQSRYAAEAGVQQTMNWMINNYTPPASPFPTAYNTSTMPVTYNGSPVVLSAVPSSAPNYPDATQQTNYKAALSAQPLTGVANETFSTYATLLSMQGVPPAFPGLPTVTVQTWQITSQGNIAFLGGTRNAQVQVVATFQRPMVAMFANALFGTGTACPTMKLAGGGITDSYDSSLGTYPAGQMNSGGNVGTDGGLTLSGSGTTVNGTFTDSPTDPCSPALSTSSGGTITGGTITAPEQYTYPTPPPPNPMPPTTNQKIDNKGCDTGGLSLPGSGCTTVTAGTDEVLASANPPTGPVGGPALYGNLGFSNSSNTIELVAGTYNVNSLSLGSGVTLKIDSCPVVLNLAGQSISSPNPVLDMSGGTLASGFPPSCFEIVYGGTAPIILSGGTSAAGIVYAPNSAIKFTGGSSWFGAVIGASIDDTGGTQVHYDRTLGTKMYMAGNWVPLGFSWSKF